jgi:hypothetical protein
VTPERGGYASGDRTAGELAPPPASVTLTPEEVDEFRERLAASQANGGHRLDIHIAGTPVVKQALNRAAHTIGELRGMLRQCEPVIRCPGCGQRYGTEPCGYGHEHGQNLIFGDEWPEATGRGYEQPDGWAGTCVITWPRPASPGAALMGWAVTITDADTGGAISTVTAIDAHLHVSPEQVIWLAMTMFADHAGRPIYDGMPVVGDDSEVITRTFPFLVSEMRVATGGLPSTFSTPACECGRTEQVAWCPVAAAFLCPGCLIDWTNDHLREPVTALPVEPA